jgi:hypothetical protein
MHSGPRVYGIRVRAEEIVAFRVENDENLPMPRIRWKICKYCMMATFLVRSTQSIEHVAVS